MHRPLMTACLLGTALLVGACASQKTTEESLFGLITPYRIEIVQGNAVTKEQADALKIGMARHQVRDVLGSPLLADLFHADRWDYIFTIRRQGAEPQRRSVVLHFKDDKLARIEAPDLPTENEFVAAISPKRKNLEARKLVLTEDERKALPVPPAQPAPAAEPSGPVRNYPPLEAS